MNIKGRSSLTGRKFNVCTFRLWHCFHLNPTQLTFGSLYFFKNVMHVLNNLVLISFPYRHYAHYVLERLHQWRHTVDSALVYQSEATVSISPIRFQAEPWTSFLVAELWGWNKKSQTPGMPEPAQSLNSPSCPPAGRCWEAYLGRAWERREEGTPWTEWWWRRGREQVGTCPLSSAPTAKHNNSPLDDHDFSVQSLISWLLKCVLMSFNEQHHNSCWQFPIQMGKVHRNQAFMGWAYYHP